MNIAKFSRTAFFIEQLWWLFLSNISFDQTIRVTTARSGFSDVVDLVRISKIRQDNHYVKQVFIHHQKYTIVNG